MAKLIRSNQFSRQSLMAFIVIAVAAGLLLLVKLFAASNPVAFEAETGSLNGPAVTTTPARASNGTAIKFGPGTPVEAYGAKGDGTSDDTGSLNQAFQTAPAGSTVVLGAGKTYRHTGVINATVTGLHITGPGTLLGTNPSTSSVWLNADNIKLDAGVVIKTTNVTQRYDAYEQMGLRLAAKTGITVSNITVDGSAAAGIYIGGASNYTITDVTVQNTWADAIHNTEGSHDGSIIRPTIINPGDDGVAIVSYASNAGIANNISVQSPKFYGSTHGRAYSVVGGTNITFSDVYAEASESACIYIASEGNYNTKSVQNVKFLGGTLKNCNASTAVDHGAILVFNGQSAYSIDQVDIENVTITNTRASASRNVAILGYGNPISRVQLRGINITGGPSTAFATDVAGDKYNTLGWVVNGSARPDHTGFTPLL